MKLLILIMLLLVGCSKGDSPKVESGGIVPLEGKCYVDKEGDYHKIQKVYSTGQVKSFYFKALNRYYDSAIMDNVTFIKELDCEVIEDLKREIKNQEELNAKAEEILQRLKEKDE